MSKIKMAKTRSSMFKDMGRLLTKIREQGVPIDEWGSAPVEPEQVIIPLSLFEDIDKVIGPRAK